MKSQLFIKAHGSPPELGSVAPIVPGSVGEIQPEFLEIPDVQRLYGIRRTTLYGLFKTGEVKSILLRRPGCQTGKRLVVVSSVRDFLQRELSTQATYTPAICNAREHGGRQ